MDHRTNLVRNQLRVDLEVVAVEPGLFGFLILGRVVASAGGTVVDVAHLVVADEEVVEACCGREGRVVVLDG
jgi:hypothetical protein